jgi:hypothetical protein
MQRALGRASVVQPPSVLDGGDLGRRATRRGYILGGCTHLVNTEHVEVPELGEPEAGQHWVNQLLHVAAPA